MLKMVVEVNIYGKITKTLFFNVKNYTHVLWNAHMLLKHVHILLDVYLVEFI